MGNRYRSPLSGGQVQLANRYADLLESLDSEFPEAFKSRQVTDGFETIGTGDLLKLKKRGLIDNEAVGHGEAKDWFLTRKTKRWLQENP